MSLRNEPHTLDQRVDWIEEFIRRWDLAQIIPAVITAVASTEHTVMFHIPGTIEVGVYEPDAPMFGANISGIRGNVATAPSGGDLTFEFRVNGVSVSTTPVTILDGTTLGVTTVPDVTAAWVADDVLDINVLTVNGATGLVINIDHVRT